MLVTRGLLRREVREAAPLELREQIGVRKRPELPLDVLDEREQIVALRGERARLIGVRVRERVDVELGFSTQEAAALAESEADLAQARTVLGGGCTFAVALRILL
jgi:hypothetical protein